MKLKWYGHSCFSLTFENGTTLVTDPFDDTVGYPLCKARADAALTSHGHFDHNYVASLQGSPRVLDSVGEYDVNGIKVSMTHTFHDPEGGRLRGDNLIMRVTGDGVTVVHLGDLGHMPDEAQLAAMSGADVLLVPIGGHFTIDTDQAVRVIELAKPKTAIAMHFANEYCHFPVTDEKRFVALTGAQLLPNEIDVTPEADLPKAAVMRYE